MQSNISYNVPVKGVSIQPSPLSGRPVALWQSKLQAGDIFCLNSTLNKKFTPGMYLVNKATSSEAGYTNSILATKLESEKSRTNEITQELVLNGNNKECTILGHLDIQA